MTLPVFPSLTATIGLATRSPTWKTLKFPSIDGSEPRYATWSYPRYAYEIPFELLRNTATITEFQLLAGFYNAVGGAALPWQFNDPDDYLAVAQPFGTGDGVTTQFQLCRAKGGFTMPVFQPIGTPALLVNGATASASVNGGGLVTFATPPAAGAALTWSGTFNWLCRFDDDQIDFAELGRGMWSLSSLKFTTEKL